MTQPKKPSKKYIYDGEIINAQNTILRLEALSYNHAIDEMDAYYKPIVKELVEALSDLIDTIHLHSLTEKHGDFCLVNDDEIEQAIEYAFEALNRYKAIK